MTLVLDTVIVKPALPPQGKREPGGNPLAGWASRPRTRVRSRLLPEIADYELRRKLIHLIHTKQADEES